MSKVAILLTDYSPKSTPIFGTYAQLSEGLLNRNGIEKDIVIYDALKCEYPTDEELQDIKTIWVTGSVHDAHGDLDWILSLLRYLKKIINDYDGKISLIGICFGHQIIARALGSKVIRNPKGWELGTHKIQLNSKDEEISTLFGSESFNILEIHQDVVTEVPAGYKNIGSTEATEIQGLYKKGKLLSFQGHPEFNQDLLELYLKDLYHKRNVIGEKMFLKSLDSLAQNHDGNSIAKTIIKFIEDDN